MRLRFKRFANLGQQDSAPDAAGLEPATESAAPVERAAGGRGSPPNAGKSRSRADLPVTIASILMLALPTLVEQFLSGGIGITDTVVAGHTFAKESLNSDIQNTAASAAVGAMTYLQWFAGLMTAALGTGATAIIARSIGAHRPRLANRVAGTVCAAAFLVGLAIALFFRFCPGITVHIFGLRGLAEDYGIRYLKIMSITICFQTAGGIGMACLRGAGDTFRPMIVTLSTALVNSLASPILTFGWFGAPRWGIEGNATGTLLAFIVCGGTTFAFLLSGTAGLQLRRRHFKIIPHLIARVLKIGLPSWLEGMLLWGGQAAIVIFAINRNDAAVGVDGATLSAHTATLRIESLAFLPGFGFGIACSALVGQYLGAKKTDEAAHTVKLCTRMAFITMTIAAVPMILFPQFMLGLMVDSTSAVATGFIPLIIAGLAQPGFAIGIIKSSALRGAGETVPPMLATITGMVLRILLVIALLALFDAIHQPKWGLIAVWISIFIDLNYRAVYNTIAFRRGTWKTKKV